MGGGSIHHIAPANQRSTSLCSTERGRNRKEANSSSEPHILPIRCIDPEFQAKPIPKPRAKKQQNDTTQNKEETKLKRQNDVADLDISDSDSEYEIQVVKVTVQRTPIKFSKAPVRVVEEDVTIRIY